MRKHIYYIAALAMVSVLGTSCNDSFLDRTPTHDLNDKSFWNTANDLEVYCNGIYNEASNGNYDIMVGYGSRGSSSTASAAWGSSYKAMLWRDVQSDNLASKVTSHASMAEVAAGLEVVPNSGGGWVWNLLRRINVFLANYDNVKEVQSVKDKYAGEAYFFRAWFYLDKVQRFGDVPWIDKPLTTESEEVYGPRDPRATVMAHVLEDINKACAFLPQSWGGTQMCRATKGAAYALKSRICLYEGTYRKYHGLSNDYNEWLNEAVKAAEECMKLGYSIYTTNHPESDYASLFNSEDLEGNPEIILYQKYVAGIQHHRLSGYIVSNEQWGATKDLVDDFLCLEDDGKGGKRAVPREVAMERGTYSEDTYEDVMTNRDPRLSQVILDPQQAHDILYNKDKYEFPRLAGMTNMESCSGYHVIKYYNKENDAKGSGSGNETTDAPVMRYAEVLLNLAEAKAELGTLTQEDVNKTINVLRKRAGMPDLVLSQIVADPKYAGLNPTLAEIRRERRVELCFENTRYQDLMRWKEGARLAQRVLGMRFEPSYFDAPHFNPEEGHINRELVNLYVDPKTGNSYLDVYKGTDYETRTFDESKHYLRPIPKNVRGLNPAITQNPKWED